MPDSTVNYAFPYPTGGDAVAVHSDIEKLAVGVDGQVHVVATAAEAGRYFRRDTTTDDTLDSLEQGAYWVPDAPEARALGLPADVQGSLRIMGGERLDTQQDAIFLSRSSPPVMYFATRFSNGWTDWQQVAVHRPGDTRTTAFSLNHPRGMDSETGRNRQVRVPFKLGARARLKRVAFRNYDYNSDTPGVGQVELVGGGIGEHQLAPDGEMTGRFVEGSTILRIASQQTAPADHSVFYGDEVDIEIEPHKEYLLSYSYEADETMTVRRQLGRCFINQIVGSWNNTSQTVTSIPQNYMGLHVWLELETDADTPVWAYFGDSQLAGLSTTNPGYDSWAQVHAYSNGAIPQILAQPGGAVADYQDPNRRMLRKWDHLDKPDRAYIALGTNDISNGRPFTGMQQFYGVAAQHIREKFSHNLYLVTTLPRTSPSPTDAVRTAFNEWLLTELPGNAIAASDHFTAVLDPKTGLMAEEWQGPGGDVHVNTAGNARLAQATDALVQPTEPPSVTYLGDGIYEIGA